MKSIWCYCAISSLILISITASANNAVIKLTKPAEIRDAMRVQKDLDLVTKKVMSCVQQKLAEPTKCFCLYPKAIESLRKSYTAALNAHSGWRDNAVSFLNAQGNYGYNINFFALRVQLEQKCK